MAMAGPPRIDAGRRTVMLAAAASILAPASSRGAEDTRAEDFALAARLTGREPVLSDRVHLQIPAVFANGYSVPMTLAVDSPMTEADHVRLVHVLAPRNPIVPVMRLMFTPQSGRAAISTRIRLAQPQTVLAIAEMSDGGVLLARSWVEVETDGCN